MFGERCSGLNPARRPFCVELDVLVVCVGSLGSSAGILTSSHSAKTCMTCFRLIGDSELTIGVNASVGGLTVFVLTLQQVSGLSWVYSPSCPISYQLAKYCHVLCSCFLPTPERVTWVSNYFLRICLSSVLDCQCSS